MMEVWLELMEHGVNEFKNFLMNTPKGIFAYEFMIIAVINFIDIEKKSIVIKYIVRIAVRNYFEVILVQPN